MTAAHSKFQEALAFHRQGQVAPARALYAEALKLDPLHFDALQLSGALAAQTGAFAEAVDLMTRALNVNPAHVATHYNLGLAQAGLGQHSSALATFEKVLTLDPQHIAALYQRGVTLMTLNRAAEAVSAYDVALAVGKHAEIYIDRGIALSALAQHQAALDSYTEALHLKPDFAEAFANRAVTLRALHRLEEAVADYDKALALKPSHPGFYNNRGAALADMQRADAAMESYGKAIALNPAFAEAYNNRGALLTKLKRHTEALDDYRKAVSLRADLVDAHVNLGNALAEMKQYAPAIDSFTAALRLNPAHPFVYGSRLHARMHIADWKNAEAETAALAEKIVRGEKATAPFQAVALFDDAALHRCTAEIWAADKHPVRAPRPPASSSQGKIRVGYFSADFRDHAVAMLLAGLIDRHDRVRFEVHGFSFGPDTGDFLRKRLQKSFDVFHDVRGVSDADVAALARRQGLDIAVDLGGYTQDARTGIFAARAAPIQVNFLGYPGTLGIEVMDYIIADETIIPDAAFAHYHEKTVRLPNSYLPNGAERVVSQRTFTRAALGLPENAFVFCCFNNSYKITPAIFDIWMRILKQAKDSVLWLAEDNSSVAGNLRKEAERRGVAPSRLVFANRIPDFSDHLARYRAADLFLDTLPYNAHTTAADALWAGLPVLTRLGESFPGRVAAGVLKAVGLPELVTTSRQEYRDLAVALAADPARVSALKQKLAENRAAAPLFNIELFARHLEDAYTQMKARADAGQAPDHITVRGAVPNR